MMPVEVSITHIRTAKRFAENFIAALLSWAKSGTQIEARAHVGVMDGVTVFVFTLGQPFSFFQTIDQALVSKLMRRAKEISPTCEPEKGDLCVFDGKKMLMFRRFDERLTPKRAKAAAKEVASYILWKKLEA